MLDIQARFAKPRLGSPVATQPKRSVPLAVLLVLAALAAADGVYLMLVHIDYTAGVNTVAGACHELAEHGCSVTAGRFGQILGIPVAALGFAGAVATGVCGGSAWTRRNRHHDPFRSLLLALAGISVLASAVMGTLSAVEASFCPFCVIWYGINLALLFAAWAARNRGLSTTDLVDDLTSNSTFVALGVFVSALIGGVLWHHSRLARMLAEQDRMVEANAEQIAARILEKNQTLTRGPIRDLRMRDNPTKYVGDATDDAAEVVLIEFGDFQCPFCKKLWDSLETYLASTTRSVRIHFAHYPLNDACNPGVANLHPDACLAAAAAVCAAAQGKFWEFGAVAFANQTRLERSDLVRYAATVGLDADAFGTCLESAEAAAAVRRDIALGVQADLTATPTLVVNGYVVTGAFPPAVLGELVDQVLAHQAANPAADG